MKTADEIREFIEKEILNRGLSLAGVSQQIGKNAAYLHQFINKGSPVRLPEEQRHKLAYILQIDEQELTDVPLMPHFTGTASAAEKLASFLTKDDVVIDMIDATACCGDGIDNLPEKVCGHWKLPAAEFKSITAGQPENIKMLRVQGDSMMPTINEGDFVWVDISNNFASSDGIYLIRMATGLAVKRLQAGLSDIVIKSDNSRYSDITAAVGEIQIIGKVVYILNGRKA